MMDEFTVQRIARDLEEKMNSSEVAIEIAAESKYQQGKIAEEELDYYSAAELYEGAIKLAPDEKLYVESLKKLTEKMESRDGGVSEVRISSVPVDDNLNSDTDDK